MNKANKLLFITITFIISYSKSFSQSDEVTKAETIAKLGQFQEEKVLPRLSFPEWFSIALPWVSQDFTTFAYYEKLTMSGKKYGIIKLPSDTLTQAIFENVNGEFGYGVAVSNGNKLGFVDSAGKLAIPTGYDELLCFDNKNGFVKKNNKIALVSYSGKVLTPFIFDDVDGFYDDVSRVTIKDKHGYIDRTGKYIAECKFNYATTFVQGFAKIYYDKWEQIEKLTYYHGNIPVSVNVGYTKSIPFLLNTKGQKIFSGKDGDEISISLDSFAIIKRQIFIDGNDYYIESVINSDGKVIIPFDRKISVSGITKDWFITCNPFAKKFGIYSKVGKELLQPSFHSVEPIQYNNNTLGAAYFDEDNYFYINKDGKCVEFEGIKCPFND